MPTLRKLTLAASLAVMVVMGIAIGHTAGAAAPHAQGTRTATVHSVTFRGIDFRPLDFRVVPQHVENTGGGVYVQIPDASTIPEHNYLEADPYLPVGALLKDVTFFYRDCGTFEIDSRALGTWYAFAYAPSTSTGSYFMSKIESPVLSCDTTVSFTHTFAPAVKVLAGRVYAIGVDSGYERQGNQPGSTRLLIVGGRVRYTCPNGC